MRVMLTLLFAALLACNSGALAQKDAGEANPAVSYKLTFTVRDLAGGKLAGVRTFQTVITTDPNGGVGNSSIRAGNRVPVPIASGTSPAAASEYQYTDLGVNIDCRTGRLGEALKPNTLRLFVSADISSLTPPEQSSQIRAPLTRQDRWSSEFLLSLGKPTLLFSSDDPYADHTTQIELTAVQLP